MPPDRFPPAPLKLLLDRYRNLPHIELAAYIGVSIAMLTMLPALPNQETDWGKTYAPAALDWLRGVHAPWELRSNFAYPPFVLPLIAPLALLGAHAGFVVFMALMLTALYASARMLGGSPMLIVLSYPGIWMLAYGQLEPLVCLGAALGWYALRREKSGLLGMAYVLLAIKPQTGFAPALLYFLWTPTWKARFQSCWLPAAVIGWTFVNWGLWPLDFLPRVVAVDNGVAASIGVSLWPIIGPLALALFAPAVLTPTNRKTRLLLVLAANALASPYSPAYSLLTLLAFPLPWWGYVAASIPAINANGSIFIRAAILLPLGLLIYRGSLPTARE